MFLIDTNISFWSELWSQLKFWDKALFLKINNDWTNDFFNSIMPWWRDSNTWIPLYLFLALFAFINFGWKVWPWVLFFIVTVTITDQVSSHLIKTFIQRARPCNDNEMQGYVHALLGYCSGSYSFPSSHATNHFGMAFYIYLTMKPYFKKWGYLFFIWAASIAYAQVYIGIHYPIDVLCGAILGSLIGIGTASMFNRKVGLPSLKMAPDNIN